MEFAKDKRGQGAFAGIIIMAAGLVALVAMFSIAPLIGHSVDTAIDIPSDEYAKGTLTFTGTTTFNQTVNVSTETYTFVNETLLGHAKYSVPIVTSQNASYSCAALVAEITANSSLVGAVDNGDNSTTLTADTIGAAANSYGTTTSVTGASFGATTLTGGVDGSDWNAADNSNVPTGLSIWTSNAPLLALVVTVSILVMVIGAIMTFGSIGRRRGRD